MEPETATCPIPLSKVTDVALVEVHVSVVPVPRMTAVGCAARVNVGAGCGPGPDCGLFDFTPEQAVKATMSSRARTGLNMTLELNSVSDWRLSIGN